MNAMSYREEHSIILDKQYFNFAAAHFLIFADGEREPLHGHNYRAEVELHAGLGDASLVADFIEVKPLFKAACDTLDHRTLLPTDNPALDVTEEETRVSAQWRGDIFTFPRADVVLIEGDNTSSEALAAHLCEQFLNRLATACPTLHLSRVVVTVSESPGQAARYARSWAAPPALPIA
ncbi:MAG: 6-pyruvoyl trahydropterin synthase family protein [Myxococcota bacterium]